MALVYPLYIVIDPPLEVFFFEIVPGCQSMMPFAPMNDRLNSVNGIELSLTR